MLRRFLSLFLLCGSPLLAMMAGNPADPALMEKGICTNYSLISFRVGYTSDWIYKQRFKDEFLIREDVHTRNQLSTYAGMATLNFIKRLDLYAILGASRLEVDDQIFSKRAYSWSVGSKVMFLKHKNLYLGADVKYFETDQKPRYFVIEGSAYNVVGEFRAKLLEAQASLGMAYKYSLFVPYVNATYIYTHISHVPQDVAFRFPDEDVIGSTGEDLPKSLLNPKRWGLALGFSLLDASKMALALEWRVFNQNGVNVNGELRF